MPDALAVAGIGGREQMDHHQRPLALAEVAERLLAVHRLGPGEVEDVVPDLERRAQEEAEPQQRSRSPARLRVPISAPDPQRQQRRVPAGLLHDQVEVVVRVRSVRLSRCQPSSTRLPVDGLPGHEVELRPDPGASRRPSASSLSRSAPSASTRQPVAGVDGQRPAVLAVQRGLRRAATRCRPRRRRGPGRRCAAARGRPPRAGRLRLRRRRPRHVARHSAGRRPLPPRPRYSAAGARRYSDMPSVGEVAEGCPARAGAIAPRALEESVWHGRAGHGRRTSSRSASGSEGAAERHARGRGSARRAGPLAPARAAGPPGRSPRRRGRRRAGRTTRRRRGCCRRSTRPGRHVQVDGGRRGRRRVVDPQ